MHRLPTSTLVTRHGLALMLASTLSCGGGEPTGPSDGFDPPVARMVMEHPTFAIVQELVERNGCTGASCHLSGQGELYLGYGPQVDYGNLVNVPAHGEPEFLRVDPGSPDLSYIVIKVEGRQSFGDAMPIGGPPIDSIDLANLRNWITVGAPDF
jgi:hypothetical protein